MSNDTQTFYIKIFGRFGIVMILFFTPVLWVAWGRSTTLLVGLAFFVFGAFVTPILCTVVVSQSGVVLNRVNRARWQDLTAARRVTVLGLPYLLVQRRKGLRWWIPLYLSRPEEFRRSLIANAPLGNPLREYAAGDI